MAPYGWLTIRNTNSTFSSDERRVSKAPEIEDRPGFRQQRGARPAHKSINERITSRPRRLE